ncbi:hypothetical protein [Acetivibrio thermocellus]|uniref:hypothetical protein n=1 Tax=Acetivibrio thermocellus TaxID=1515 RepID=UPI0002F9D214|nr:hypothetical protein [Acetivibrio thermocellus]
MLTCNQQVGGSNPSTSSNCENPYSYLSCEGFSVFETKEAKAGKLDASKNTDDVFIEKLSIGFKRICQFKRMG